MLTVPTSSRIHFSGTFLNAPRARRRVQAAIDTVDAGDGASGDAEAAEDAPDWIVLGEPVPDVLPPKDKPVTVYIVYNLRHEWGHSATSVDDLVEAIRADFPSNASSSLFQNNNGQT